MSYNLSYNHRMFEVGWDLWSHLIQLPFSSMVTQTKLPTATSRQLLKTFKEGGHNLSGQPVPRVTVSRLSYSITFPEAEIRLTSLSFPRSSLPLLKMISSSSLSTYGCITTWPMNIGMSSLLKYFLTWPSSISYIFLGPVIHLGHSPQSSESAFATRRHSVFHPFLFCVKRSPGSFSSRPTFSLSSFFYLTIYRYPRVYVCMFIFSVSVVPTLLFLICDA